MPLGRFKRINCILHDQTASYKKAGYLLSTDGEVGDGVEVGLEDGRVAEHLVSERVEAVQHDLDLRRRHPFL